MNEERNKRMEIFRAIDAERGYQDATCGPIQGQNGRSGARWVQTLCEEVCEAMERFDGGAADDPAGLLELVQVAAVAVAWLEQQAPADLDRAVRAHRFPDPPTEG